MTPWKEEKIGDYFLKKIYNLPLRFFCISSHDLDIFMLIDTPKKYRFEPLKYFLSVLRFFRENNWLLCLTFSHKEMINQPWSWKDFGSNKSKLKHHPKNITSSHQKWGWRRGGQQAPRKLRLDVLASTLNTLKCYQLPSFLKRKYSEACHES